MVWQTPENTKGFTIVELLIVIVVIGILAAIVIVAFNGAQIRARNISRVTEARGYERLFKSYQSLYGELPAMPDGFYCLGRGYESGRCWQVASTDPTFMHLESNATTLMTELDRVGKIAKGNRTTAGGMVGPRVAYNGDINIRIQFALETNDPCPGGMDSFTPSTEPYRICIITIPKNP